MSKNRTTSPINKMTADAYRAAIGQVKGTAQSYAVVDYPAHNNTGDLAIWLGQKQALSNIFGTGPSYVASQQDYHDDIDTFCRDGIIFIHGGGNFGDIWPNHHMFRLHVLSRYPNRRIVQLPQSIHFSNAEHIETTKRAIGAHKDFHLYVRDQASFDFACREFDCPVNLAPDAAHCIPSYASDTPQHDIFSLVRTDKETLIPDLHEALSDYGPVADWEGLGEYFYKDEGMSSRFFRRHIQYKFHASVLMMRCRNMLYDRKAKAALDKGTRLLSQGKIVVSDRLHAHIISSLMGKPHISIDNANGKVREYIAKWGDFGVTELVNSRVSLLARLNDLQETSLVQPS